MLWIAGNERPFYNVESYLDQPELWTSCKYAYFGHRYFTKTLCGRGVSLIRLLMEICGILVNGCVKLVVKQVAQSISKLSIGIWKYAGYARTENCFILAPMAELMAWQWMNDTTMSSQHCDSVSVC